jgi:acetyltransferase-like isoleucine patch superfamily enzyme
MANHFHETVTVGKFTSIEVSSRGTHTYIGEKSQIDDFVKIKHVGGTGDIKIGSYVYINSGTVIYSGNGITIGNDVLIGPNCSLVPANHNISNLETIIRLQGFMPSKGGIIIHNNVWLGAGVIVLDGAIINEGVVVGANSLVIGELEANCIYAGNPAKKIRKR